MSYKLQKLNKKSLELIAEKEVGRTLAEQDYKTKYYTVKSMILDELQKQLYKVLDGNDIDEDKLNKIHLINELL